MQAPRKGYVEITRQSFQRQRDLLASGVATPWGWAVVGVWAAPVGASAPLNLWSYCGTSWVSSNLERLPTPDPFARQAFQTDKSSGVVSCPEQGWTRFAGTGS